VKIQNATVHLFRRFLRQTKLEIRPFEWHVGETVNMRGQAHHLLATKSPTVHRTTMVSTVKSTGQGGLSQSYRSMDGINIAYPCEKSYGEYTSIVKKVVDVSRHVAKK